MDTIRRKHWWHVTPKVPTKENYNLKPATNKSEPPLCYAEILSFCIMSKSCWAFWLTLIYYIETGTFCFRSLAAFLITMLIIRSDDSLCNVYHLIFKKV